jgi:hypothetical protein
VTTSFDGPAADSPRQTLCDQLASDNQDERTAAVAEVVDKLVRATGVRWEDILVAHERRSRSLPDTGWMSLPPVDGWPGLWRRLHGHILIARQHGKHGFYATADGLLIPINRGAPLAPSAEWAMQMAEEFARNPDLSSAIGTGPEMELVDGE